MNNEVKKIINIPKKLNQKLQEVVKELGITESSFIKFALWEKLKEFKEEK